MRGLLRRLFRRLLRRLMRRLVKTVGGLTRPIASAVNRRRGIVARRSDLHGGKMPGYASTFGAISLGTTSASSSSTPFVSDLFEDVMLEGALREPRPHGPHERCC